MNEDGHGDHLHTSYFQLSPMLDDWAVKSLDFFPPGHNLKKFVTSVRVASESSRGKAMRGQDWSRISYVIKLGYGWGMCF